HPLGGLGGNLSGQRCGLGELFDEEPCPSRGTAAELSPCVSHTASASRATRRAIVTSSELMRCTSTSRSSLLRCRLALIDRARLSTERVRSAIFVRLAKPIACSFFVVLAILATPF